MRESCLVNRSSCRFKTKKMMLRFLYGTEDSTLDSVATIHVPLRIKFRF